MTVREYLEQGRNLAERIPYAIIALTARLALPMFFGGQVRQR
jgi:hypothetical protein